MLPQRNFQSGWREEHMQRSQKGKIHKRPCVQPGLPAKCGVTSFLSPILLKLSEPLFKDAFPSTRTTRAHEERKKRQRMIETLPGWANPGSLAREEVELHAPSSVSLHREPGASHGKRFPSARCALMQDAATRWLRWATDPLPPAGSYKSPR